LRSRLPFDAEARGSKCAKPNQAVGGLTRAIIIEAFDAPGHALFHTISPFTTVAIGPPRKLRPWKGELRLREQDWFTS